MFYDFLFGICRQLCKYGRVFVKTLNNARKNASGSGVFPLAFFESVQQFVFCNRQIAVGQVFLKNNQNKNTRKFWVLFLLQNAFLCTNLCNRM